jgi:hypothetical protein
MSSDSIDAQGIIDLFAIIIWQSIKVFGSSGCEGYGFHITTLTPGNITQSGW